MFVNSRLVIRLCVRFISVTLRCCLSERSSVLWWNLKRSVSVNIFLFDLYLGPAKRLYFNTNQYLSYLAFIPHGPFAKDGHLHSRLLLQSFHGISPWSQQLPNKIKLWQGTENRRLLTNASSIRFMRRGQTMKKLIYMCRHVVLKQPLSFCFGYKDNLTIRYPLLAISHILSI